MDHPTRAQVFGALAAADALPNGFDYVNYGRKDVDRYDQALDVLAAVGWLPDPTDRSVVTPYGKGDSLHEYVDVTIAGGGTFTLSSPLGYAPLTTATRVAQPIEKLAAPPVSAPVVMRVGDVIVEIEGPGAEAIREAVAAATADDAGSPLPSRDDSRDAEIIPLNVHGRGRQDGPHGRGA